MSIQRSILRLVNVALLGMTLALPWPAQATRDACPGDCNGDDIVAVDEILSAEQLLVGLQPIEQCENADYDANFTVSVHEIILAINAALLGCGIYSY